MSETSIAHAQDGTARMYHPDGNVPWRPATQPNVEAEEFTGRLRACQFCGSMHPADLASAIRTGATVEWADFKYGWPHKVYAYKVPNPHAGMTEVRSMAISETPGYERVASPRYNERTGERVADHVRWVQKSEAEPTTQGKFYTVHLQDATPEDRETIERAMGLRFTFEGRGVRWEPYPVREHPAVTAMQPLDSDGKAPDPEAAADTQDAS